METKMEKLVTYWDNIYGFGRALVKIKDTKEERIWLGELQKVCKSGIVKANEQMKLGGGRFYRGLGILRALKSLSEEASNKELFLTDNKELNDEAKRRAIISQQKRRITEKEIGDE